MITNSKDQAMFLYNTGKYKSATKALKEYLASNRQDYEAQFYFGLSLYETGRYNESLEQWKKLKKMAPNRKNIHLNMACAYQFLGRDDLAIRNFKFELSINPVCGEALYSLGALYYKRRSFGRASEYLQRCYAMNHSRDQIVGRLANCYFKNRQLQKEIYLYDEWLKSNPRDTWALNNLGVALMQYGEYNRARLYFKKALAITSSDEIVQRNLLKAQSLQKRFDSRNLSPAEVPKPELYTTT